MRKKDIDRMRPCSTCESFLPANAKNFYQKKDGITYDIDLHFISTLLKEQAYCCAISKVKLTFTKGEGHIPTNASIDRIDPRKGYTKDNIQIVAWQVNVMKSNLGTTQLAEWCRLVLHGLGNGIFMPYPETLELDQSL